MSSEVGHKIPVINFNDKCLKPGSDSWVQACKQIRYGLEEYGCFEIVCNKFPPELHNSIFGAAEEFFDLPLETKMQKVTDRPGAIGYVGGRQKVPLYETIGIDSTTTLEGVDHFANIMWPAGNNTFRESMHSFSQQVEEFHEMITRMVFENYSLEGHFNSFWEKIFYVFRFFKYKPPQSQTKEGEMGLFSHTDTSWLSILHQTEVEGLQIKAKDDKWVDIKPHPSSFVILAGDVLQVWSNDRVRACEHQVIMKQDKVRYSVGLFTFIEGVLHVPEELVDDEHPLRYKPFDRVEYYRFLFEEGSKYTCPIKAFCAI